MENIPLRHGDKITFGLSTTVFRFWDSEDKETEAPKDTEETLLAQQPSSTSQSEETGQENDSDPTKEVRFVKPAQGEVNDLMPMESEIDPNVVDSEPSRYFIRIYNSDGEQASEIGLKKLVPVYVGRALGCQIDLLQPSISRRHCVFQYKYVLVDAFGKTIQNSFCIYDLKSTHGTFLNEKQIPSMENIPLRHGDKITFGLSTTVFRFWDSEDKETEAPKDTEETLLAQQPSSTSQSEETGQENDSWHIRYSKVLNQLVDMTKEYEETGNDQKIKQQNKKLVQQVQATISLINQTNNALSEPKTPEPLPKKRRGRVSNKMKEVVIEPEQSPVVRKRGRRSRKEIEAAEAAKKKEAQKVDQQKLAQEVQKQIQATLSHKSNSDEESIPSKVSQLPSDDILNTNAAPGFEGDFVLAENNPLSMINAPLFQPLDHESDSDMINQAPIVTNQRGRRTIKRPKKLADEGDFFLVPSKALKKADIPSNDKEMSENPIKKRRGRRPRAKESPIEETTSNPEQLEAPATVKRKRGRQPNLLKAAQKEMEHQNNGVDAENMNFLEQLPQETTPPVKRKRGRRPNILKALLTSKELPITKPENVVLPLTLNTEELPTSPQVKRKRGRQPKSLPKAQVTSLDVIPTTVITEETHKNPRKPLKKKKEFNSISQISNETSQFSSKSPPRSELIAVNSPIPFNINGNGNYSPLTLTIDRPVVLLKRLDMQNGSGKNTPELIERQSSIET